jgi:hypothetical protein
MKYLNNIQKYSDNVDTDISSNLPTIYKNTFSMQPKRIVELGVRSGESSLIFSYINKELNSTVIGVDINNCDYNNIYNETFIYKNDCKYVLEYNNYYKNNIDVYLLTHHICMNTLLLKLNYGFHFLIIKHLLYFTIQIYIMEYIKEKMVLQELVGIISAVLLEQLKNILKLILMKKNSLILI